MSEFKWTDELRKEYAEFLMQGWDNPPEALIEIFKSRKLQNTYTVKADESNVVDGGSKDWEVLSLKGEYGGHPDVLFEYNSYTGFYVPELHRLEYGIPNWTLNDVIKNHNGKIHSVKRISDNSVWTIGDEIIFDNIPFHIEGFSIEFGKLLHVKIKHNGIVDISSLQKQKPILFTTEDGNPIYEGDNAWCVHSDFEIIHYKHIEGDWAEEDEKWFSTEKAANTYISENKPVLSYKHIADILNRCKFHNRSDRPDEDYWVAWVSLVEEELKELVKLKINK